VVPDEAVKSGRVPEEHIKTGHLPREARFNRCRCWSASATGAFTSARGERVLMTLQPDKDFSIVRGQAHNLEFGGV
jgi:hypothetical protein